MSRIASSRSSLDGKTKIIPSIRVLPDAKKSLLLKQILKEYPMHKVHNDGLFEAIIWDKKTV